MVINQIVGVYIPIISFPIKGGMTIPNTMSLDPGTYVAYASWCFCVAPFLGRTFFPEGLGEGTRSTCGSGQTSSGTGAFCAGRYLLVFKRNMREYHSPMHTYLTNMYQLYRYELHRAKLGEYEYVANNC